MFAIAIIGQYCQVCFCGLQLIFPKMSVCIWNAFITNTNAHGQGLSSQFSIEIQIQFLLTHSILVIIFRMLYIKPHTHINKNHHI